MYNVLVERECGCFKKSNLESKLTIESKDDALLKSIEMCSTMNEDFCSKHKFEVREQENNFIIAMKV